MTHAPSGEGGGGGGAGGGSGGGESNVEVNRGPEQPSTNTQVVALVSPAGASEAAATGAAAEALGEKAPLDGGRGDAHAHKLPLDYRPTSTPTPPDGGWGWVVVFASFMIHVVNDGVTYSFGIFYDALITYFDSGRGETAWILSILVGVTLCSGPISSSLVNKYGCRPVTIVGAVLGSVSLLLSVFAPNVQTLYLTIGLGTGLGFGLVYLPAIVSVTCYFERLRSLATGIAVCGSGLGTFLLAPLTKWLVDSLGWRHALLVISALVLKCAAYGALFRPLAPNDEHSAQVEASSSSVEELRLHAAAAACDLHARKEKELQLNASERELFLEAHSPLDGDLHRPRSMGHLAPGVGAVAFLPSRSALARGGGGGAGVGAASAGAAAAADSEGGPSSRFAKSQPTLAVSYSHPGGSAAVEEHREVEEQGRQRTWTMPSPPTAEPITSHASPNGRFPIGYQGGVETRLALTSSRGSGIMYRKDILYSGSLRNLQHHKSASHLHAEAAHLLGSNAGAGVQPFSTFTPTAPNGLANTHSGGAFDTSIVDNEDTSADRQRRLCGCVKLSPETDYALREMLDFSLLKDPVFIVFTISNFLTSVGFNVPYLYVAVQAKTRGLNDDSAGWLLSAIGFANTVGRIVLGYISDKPWVNRLLVYNICLTICGVATAFSALCNSYTSFMVYSCVFGASIGAYVGLTSVVLVDLLGLERLTNAFGLLLLFQGIASLIGPPIAGWLYDATESYDPGFIGAGVTMGLSGVMLFIIPPLQRRLAYLRKQNLELQPSNGSALRAAVA